MNEVTSRDDVRNALLTYLDTDTIWYDPSFPSMTLTRPDLLWTSFHQDYPEPLVRLQADHWNPLLTWARDTFDVELLTSDSVLFNTQPEATKRKLDKVLQGFDPWQMAGCVHYSLLSLMVYSSKVADSDGARDVYDQVFHHCARTRIWPHHCRKGCVGVSSGGREPDRAVGGGRRLYVFYLFVFLPMLKETQLTMLTIMTCDGTLAARLVY